MAGPELPLDRLGLDDPLDAEALAWLVRTLDDPAAEAACAIWRAEDPAHEQAWRRVSRVWRKTAALAGADEFKRRWRPEIDRLARRPPKLYAYLPLAAAACLLVTFVTPLLVPAPEVRASTRTAEIRQVALVDGSRMTVGPRSDVNVRLAPFSRMAVIGDGEVFFQVAHDPRRPFTVRAGDALIRVTGTQFDVRATAGAVRVSVLNGRVEVRRRTFWSLVRTGAPQRVLSAGQMSELARGARTFSVERPTDGVTGAWRDGRLYYVEAPLGEVLADVQRYTPTPIRVADSKVAQMRLTMSFDGNRLQAFLDDLPAILPVRETRTADGAVVLSARPDGVR
jgi:transmembrane sensor